MTPLDSGSLIGAFLSSGVEFLEIVAIAYALAASGYRREALLGSAAGILGVTLAGALLDSQLIFVPLRWLLETFEVALIVITIGLSSRAWFEALSGATLALAATVGFVFLLHGRLQKLPDVLIKLGAGLMLLTLGTYWLLEGLGMKWPMEELSAIPLFALFILSTWIAILVMRRQSLRKSALQRPTQIPN